METNLHTKNQHEHNSRRQQSQLFRKYRSTKHRWPCSTARVIRARSLMGEKDLPAFFGGFEDSQADLQCRFSPSAVVKDRSIVGDGLIQLLHLSLAPSFSRRKRHLLLSLIAINQQPVRRLPNVPLVATHEHEA